MPDRITPERMLEAHAAVIAEHDRDKSKRALSVVPHVRFMNMSATFAPWTARLLMERVIPLLRSRPDESSSVQLVRAWNRIAVDTIATIEAGCGEEG